MIGRPFRALVFSFFLFQGVNPLAIIERPSRALMAGESLAPKEVIDYSESPAPEVVIDYSESPAPEVVIY